MKITVIAATGRIGSSIVEQAIAAGHDVTAVARNPGRVRSGVHALRVDLSTQGAADLEPAVEGADAVLSALGPRSNADTGVVSRGTQEVIKAMDATGVRRLIVVSAAPVGTLASPARPNPPRRDPGEGWFTSHLLTPLVKKAFARQYADLAVMEDELRDSSLDWTAVRPPRLVNRSHSGRYRTAIGQNVRGGRSIGRPDVAHLMLALIENPGAIRQTVGVGY